MHRIRLTIAATCSAALLALTACGDEAPVDSDPSTSQSQQATDAPANESDESGTDELSSATDGTWQVTEDGGTTYLVGHGLVLEVPSEWTDYEDEFEGTDGTTVEWAYGMPADTEPLPYGLQFSTGLPGAGGGQVTEGIDVAAKKVAELEPGYELLDEGGADVEGAQQATFLRFNRDMEIGGETVKVEQLSLFIQVEDDVTSTIRFIGEAGKWDEQLGDVYDSVRVSLA